MWLANKILVSENRGSEDNVTMEMYLFERVRVMVFIATFNGRSILLVEENGVIAENHRPFIRNFISA